MKALEYGTAFAFGASLYTLIEIFWRGYTHPSMTLTGGICLSVMYLLNDTLGRTPRPLKWLAGALSVSVIEFAVGCVVNLWLKQEVWDYSDLPFNLLGQVSPQFTLAWYGLSIPGFFLCELIKKGTPTFNT